MSVNEITKPLLLEVTCVNFTRALRARLDEARVGGRYNSRSEMVRVYLTTFLDLVEHIQLDPSLSGQTVNSVRLDAGLRKRLAAAVGVVGLSQSELVRFACILGLIHDILVPPSRPSHPPAPHA